MIAGTIVDVDAELVNDPFLQMAKGNSGYENGFAATYTPYMFPDNNTAVASLFNYKSIINPNSKSIKCPMGAGTLKAAPNIYIELYYGGSITNPPSNSLCGKILARMKEIASQNNRK